MNKDKSVQVAYFLLRVVVGMLFVQHGGKKLFGWFGGGDAPALMSQMGIGGILELVGGLLVLAGLFTRHVGFLLSGMMAVAYFQFHQSKGTWPIQNGGESAVLFCFIFLLIAAFGGGEWSLDALIRRKREGAASGG